MSQEFAVIGGAGFIGSHISEALIKNGKTVTVIANVCSGKIRHLDKLIKNSNLQIRELYVEDTAKLCEAIKGSRVVIHLASNPDIARAAHEPRIDFTQGTVLTESVVEAARVSDVSTLLYASGSGVYGDAGVNELTEDSHLNPISTYGASKLAGESLLASYSYMFDLKCIAFRFANVVGPKQTHGVGYDFLRRLKTDPSKLEILGDGKQNKSYIYVTDVIEAVLLAEEKVESGYDVFNISTQDQITVSAIAEITEEILGIEVNTVQYFFSGGDRGWKGDVPRIKLSSEKIRKLGWVPRFTSHEAMQLSIQAMKEELNS